MMDFLAPRISAAKHLGKDLGNDGFFSFKDFSSKAFRKCICLQESTMLKYVLT
jgi:hypothetical protein